MSVSVSNEFTFCYAGFTFITEEMLFFTTHFTTFIPIWTIIFKIKIVTFVQTIKLSSITKWRKCVIDVVVMHFFWNTSSNFCLPKAEIMAQIKLECLSERFRICNETEFLMSFECSYSEKTKTRSTTSFVSSKVQGFAIPTEEHISVKPYVLSKHFNLSFSMAI